MEERIRNNFRQAIKILKKVPQGEFDMRDFRQNPEFSGYPKKWMTPYEFKSKHDCGTVGCALGNLPLYGTDDLAPIESDFEGECPVLKWNLYGYRIFGYMPSDAWGFLFGASWFYHDNTPKGAAKRMEYYLKNKNEIDKGNWVYEDFER